MSIIAITDYFDAPGPEERAVLGDLVGTEVADDTEVLMVWHTEIDEAYVSGLPRLRGVQRYGVGFDNLDLPALKGRGLVCCNNPDYGVDEVSDTAVAMILNITRGVLRYNELAKGLRDTWQENVLGNLRRSSEITVGVIGAGRIGGSVLLKCHGLGFRTCMYDPYRDRGYEKMLGATRYDTLDELLAVADIVSIHAPLTPETRGMVDAGFVSRMRPGASLVNTARGRIVDDLDVLFEALRDGRLEQVALDVLPDEPPPDGELIRAWRDAGSEYSRRIVINPHTSYFSTDSYSEIRRKAAENALRIYKGEAPFNRL